MDLGLRGRRVLITGGSQGIGYSVAAGFMAEGCDVVIVARDQSRLETATASLAQLGTGQVEAASIDLAQAGAAEELAKAGITAGTVRVSIGIEDAEDLIADLKQALN